MSGSPVGYRGRGLWTLARALARKVGSWDTATWCTGCTSGGSNLAGRQNGAAARRGDVQTVTGAGPGRPGTPTSARATERAPTRSSSCSQWCKQAGVEVVTLWLLSTDNLTRPAGGARPAARDHRGHRQRPGRRGLAREPGGRARPAARPHRPRAEGRRRGDRQQSRACSSTWPSATAGGARSPTRSQSLLIEHASKGTTIEQLAEVLDVEHIAEHLYTAGAARPGPGDQDQRRAAARRVPAVAVDTL